MALLGYWKLNEANGDAADSSGNGKTATNNGTTGFNAGKLNNSAVFTGNGKTKYFQTADWASWDFGAGNFTIAFWIKNGSVGGARKHVLSTDTVWISHNNIFIIFATSGKIRFDCNADDGTGFESSSALDDGNWHRCVVVRSGTGANQTRWYIDGNGDTTSTVGGTFENATGIYMGSATAAGPYNGMSGDLDDVQIWNEAWDAAHIAADWNGGAGAEYPFSTPTNCQLCVDTGGGVHGWKTVTADGIQANIGDVWKQVEGCQLCVDTGGGVHGWKTVF